MMVAAQQLPTWAHPPWQLLASCAGQPQLVRAAVLPTAPPIAHTCCAIPHWLRCADCAAPLASFAAYPPLLSVHCLQTALAQCPFEPAAIFRPCCLPCVLGMTWQHKWSKFFPTAHAESCALRAAVHLLMQIIPPMLHKTQILCPARC